jgi:hypothetical protein
LHDIIEAHDPLHLDNPFTNEKIKEVIKDIPTYRAPGPDGFNGYFLKK